jgi:hypothetical protein
MKIGKKDIIFWILIAAVAVTLIFILKPDNKQNALNSPSPTPTATPTVTPGNSKVPTPTPGYLIVKESRTYQGWFDELDPENRVLRVYSECDYIVPSNLTYKNNTKIMLDNTGSSENHVLKIGGKEYNLEAGLWYLVTLSSPTVPARLPIFCKGIELGEVELN